MTERVLRCCIFKVQQHVFESVVFRSHVGAIIMIKNKRIFGVAVSYLSITVALKEESKVLFWGALGEERLAVLDIKKQR